MKSSVEVALIASIAIIGSTVTWLANGSPSGARELEIIEQPLKEGEIRLSQLLEEGIDNVLWVDARKADAWKENGLAGSIHITSLSDASLEQQVADHLDQLSAARRVIIYCSDLHCTLSHDLAKRLQTDQYRDIIPGEILVLQGGVTALQAAGMIKNPSPTP